VAGDEEEIVQFTLVSAWNHIHDLPYRHSPLSDICACSKNSGI